MKQIETITWLPFPENKPEDGKTYLVERGASPQMFTTHRYADKYEKENQKWEGVFAYAELPKGYDPDAKTFNFQTALNFIKTDIHYGKVMSLATKRKFWYVGDSLYAMDKDECIETYANFRITEIEGEWEEV